MHRFRFLAARPDVLFAFLVTGLLGSFPGSAGAATLSWNFIGGGLASTAANWSPAAVPAAADALVFALPGTYSVVFDAIVDSSASLTHRAGTVTYTFTVPHRVTGSLLSGTTTGDTGQFRLTTGSLTTSANSNIGNVAGTNMAFSVDDADALFTVAGSASDLTIGAGGQGILSVTGGGKVDVGDDFVVGGGSGSVGTATVSGAGTPSGGVLTFSQLRTLTSNGDFFIGNNGIGALSLQDGGVATSADDILIGLNPTAQGTVSVGTGARSSFLNATDGLDIARNDAPSAGGTGTLVVSAGGTVTVPNRVRVGDPDGGTGTLHMNGGTFTARTMEFDATHGLLDFDGGTLRVTGGTVTGPVVSTFGSTVGPANFEVLHGARWNMPGSLFQGSGPSLFTVLVRDGGSLYVQNSFLQAGSNALTIDSSSVMDVAGRLALDGNLSGSGSRLRLTNGSTLLVNSMQCADEGTDSCNVVIEGAGSVLKLRGPLFLSGNEDPGIGGPTSFNVQDGGAVTAVQPGVGITVKQNGTLRVRAGGQVTITAPITLLGRLELDGGTVKGDVELTGNGALLGKGTVNGRILGGTAGVTRIRATGPLVLGASDQISGVNFQGDLDCGPTVVHLKSADDIFLRDSVRVAGGALVSDAVLQCDGTLEARGQVATPLLIANNFMKIEGPVPAQVEVAGGLRLTSGAILALRVNGPGPGQADFVRVLGNAELSGTLAVNISSLASYPSGAIIPLMSFASRSGSIPSLDIGGIPVNDPKDVELLLSPTTLSIRINTPVVGVDPSPVAPPPALALAGRFDGGRTEFELSLPQEAIDARLEVYDVTGRRVARLAEGPLAAGTHRFALHGGAGTVAGDGGAGGRRLPGGIYFARATLRLADGGVRRLSARAVLVR